MIIAPLVRRMFRISPKGDQIVSVQGHKMLFGVASEAHLDMSEGTWEPGVVTLLKNRLSLGMTFVDLGHITITKVLNQGSTRVLQTFESPF